MSVLPCQVYYQPNMEKFFITYIHIHIYYINLDGSNIGMYNMLALLHACKYLTNERKKMTSKYPECVHISFVHDNT